MKRSLIMWIVVFLLVAAGGAFVVTNRARLGSAAAESVLSSLLGGAPVSVENAAIVEGRQLKLRGVVINGGLSIETATVTYDLADFLARRVDPLASVVRVDLYGLRGTESQLMKVAQLVLRDPVEADGGAPRGAHGAEASGGAASGASGASAGRGWMAPIGLIDCVIVTDDAGPIAVSRAEFRLTGTTLHIERADAEFMNISVTGSASVSLSAPLDTRAVSRASLCFVAKLEDDLEVSGELSLDASGADKLNASVKSARGTADVEFAGELEAAMQEDGPLARAVGDIRVASLHWGSARLRDWTLGADITYASGAGNVVLRGGRTDIERVIKVIGPSLAASDLPAWAPSVRGWVDWSLSFRADARGAHGAVQLMDGRISTDLLDGFEGEFTEVRGSAQLAYDAAGGRMSLGQTGLDAEFSGGLVHLEGRENNWRLVADGVGLVHQVVKARLDADVGYSGGRLEGRLALAEGSIDAVTAGFSSVPSIPDLGVDIIVSVGDGLTVEREESWAQLDAGAEVHVLGSLRKPVFSGRIGLGSGELSVSGQVFDVVSGQAVLEPGMEPEFTLTLAEQVEGEDVLLTAYGELGDIKLQLADAAAPGDDIPHSGDVLVKLIGSRVRQYILDQVAAWLDSTPPGMAGTSRQEAN